MKIGIDAREFHRGKPTGTNRLLGNLLSSFPAGAAGVRDLELILFGNQHTLVPAGLPFKLVRLTERSTLVFDQAQLPGAIRERGIDAFFSPYPKVPLAAGCRTISSVLDLTYLLFGSPWYRFKYRCYAASLLRAYAGKADTICTISEHSRNDIIRFLGVAPGKIRVVRLSVGREFVPSARDAIDRVRKTYGLEKPYLLYAGNDHPHKNLDRLLHAYGLLPPPVRSAFDLVLCGVPRVAPPAVDGVHALGYVLPADLPALYGGAHLFVFPSLYEGFGLPPLEAMACGCPVVSSNAASMPEVLGDACRYFDPGDSRAVARAMEELIGDEAGRRELARRGRERAASFTGERMLADMISLFRTAAP